MLFRSARTPAAPQRDGAPGVCALPGWQAVTVRLGWTPGDAAPAFREAESVDSLGLTHPIPSSALPPEDWFSIDSIVADLRLATLARRERVLAGYFLNSRFFEWE